LKAIALDMDNIHHHSSSSRLHPSLFLPFRIILTSIWHRVTLFNLPLSPHQSPGHLHCAFPAL
jgi:hypothetical protein